MILRHKRHSHPAVAISHRFGCGGKAAGAAP
jgi:hypothetical protein